MSDPRCITVTDGRRCGHLAIEHEDNGHCLNTGCPCRSFDQRLDPSSPDGKDWDDPGDI